MTRGSQRSNARESLFRNLPKLLRDARFLRVAGQVLAVLVFVLWSYLFGTLTYNPVAGIRLGFDFLKSQASFDIGESLIYNPANSFARAMFVGC